MIQNFGKNIVRTLSSRFIAGSNDKELLKTIRSVYEKHNWHPIVDYAKESSITDIDVERYIDTLQSTVSFLNNAGVKDIAYALKISSFGKNSYNKLDEVIRFMNINRVSKVFLDAESLRFEDLENDTFSKLIKQHNTDRPLLYKTYQLYKTDSFEKVKSDLDNYEFIGVKLVRGAYFEEDYMSKRLYTKKNDTDRNYDEVVEHVLSILPKRSGVNVLIATHNKASVERAMHVMTQLHHPQTYFERVQFAQLLGMNNDLSDSIVRSGYKVYKYMPYGSFEDTIPYLIRRLYENYSIMKYIL
jgi:proline dehydrogenase